MTTNEERAIEVMNKEHPYHEFLIAGLVRALANAGLLAPALPEPNDPSIFVPDGAGWRTPKDSVVWTAIGGCVMIQRVEPGGFTPREARGLALALLAAAEHSQKEEINED